MFHRLVDPADKIGTMTLQEWKTFARTDNCLDRMVPSDLRILLGMIPDPAEPVPLYLEAHVTIEPVFGAKLEEAGEIAREYKFRVADLLMQKDREATPERSDKDTFMTGHSRSLPDLMNRTADLCVHLQQKGFNVWRYKIEDTVLDSKRNDIWDLV